MKTRIQNRSVFALLLALIFSAGIGCGHKSEQSETLNSYSKTRNKELTGLYFYPSTIRMLSKVLGDENGKALSEIKRGRIFFSWSDDDSKVSDLMTEFKSGLSDEGFEMLMQMKSSGNKIDVYLLDRDVDDYVLFVDGEQGTFVLEIFGNLSAGTIRSLGELDMSKLTQIIDLGGDDAEAKVDSSKTQNN